MSSSSGARPAPITTQSITDARKAFVSDVEAFKQKGDTTASQRETFQAPDFNARELGAESTGQNKRATDVTGVELPETDQISALSNLFRQRASNINQARTTPGSRPIFTKDN